MTTTQNNSNPPVEKSLYRHIPPAERMGLTLSQAAEYCGIGRHTLQAYVDSGEIAVRWQGSRRIVDRASLEAWWKRGLEGGDGR